jgi:hypothetical protein
MIVKAVKILKRGINASVRHIMESITARDSRTASAFRAVRGAAIERFAIASLDF